MLLNSVGDDGWQLRLMELVHGALGEAGFNAAGPGGIAPNVGHATQAERRPQGWSLSYGFGRGRTLDPDGKEERLLELQLGEDGSLELFCGRASYIQGTGAEGPAVVFERLIVGVCRQFLAIAVAVSDASKYLGSWDFGVAITGLGGGVSSEIARNFASTATPYAADDYRGSSRSSLEELRSRPSVVADRLVGQLVRALGTRQHQAVASLLDP
jgi:hypothetical protein